MVALIPQVIFIQHKVFLRSRADRVVVVISLVDKGDDIDPDSETREWNIEKGLEMDEDESDEEEESDDEEEAEGDDDSGLYLTRTK